jgi:uncharacterized membrane protein
LVAAADGIAVFAAGLALSLADEKAGVGIAGAGLLAQAAHGVLRDRRAPAPALRRRRPWALPRSAKLGCMDNVALFFHLLGALLFVAGIVLAGAAFEAARRRERPAEIALLLGLTRVGVVLVLAGALLLLAFGLWLVHIGHVGYGAGWVDASIALYVVALALGTAAGRRPKQARRLAALLAAEEAPVTSKLRELLADRFSLLANYASAAVVLAILVLMVFKP